MLPRNSVWGRACRPAAIFATDVPLDLCDAAPAPQAAFPAPTITRSSGLGKRGGLDVIMRYSATGSSDGVNKLLQLASDPASEMLQLNHALTTLCTFLTLTTRVSRWQAI